MCCVFSRHIAAIRPPVTTQPSLIGTTSTLSKSRHSPALSAANSPTSLRAAPPRPISLVLQEQTMTYIYSKKPTSYEEKTPQLWLAYDSPASPNGYYASATLSLPLRAINPSPRVVTRKLRGLSADCIIRPLSVLWYFK